MKRMAITGAAGHLGKVLRDIFSAEVEHLRLIDRQPIDHLRSNETAVVADLADQVAMTKALEGTDSIIHLGGISVESDIASIISSNILGTHNLYEAALANGIERVVFASSNHATGFYPRSKTITPLDPMRPDSRYGLSKSAGELMAGMYYDKAGIRTLSIRIGNAAAYPNGERAAAIWISGRDLAQLVRIGLTHPDIAAAVVYGMSKSDAGWWRDDLAYRLGYRPEDTPRDYLKPEAAPEKPIAAYFQGGSFCDGDHDGVLRLRDEDGLVIQATG